MDAGAGLVDAALNEHTEEPGEHEWAMHFVFRMSPEHAEEMATGKQAEGADGPPSPWTPDRAGLVGLAGPECTRCGKGWTTAPCPGSRVGPTRAERRRAERQQAKRGPRTEISDHELQEFLSRIAG